MPTLVEILARHVELHVPEPIDVEHAAPRSGSASIDRLRQIQLHERVRRQRRPELRRLDAEREVRGRRREEIAPVECSRHGLERVGGIRELVRALDPAQLRGGHEQPVVGADEEITVRVANDDGPACAADAGIDDGEVHAHGHVRKRVAQDERAGQHALRRDSVRHVDDLDVGRDALDDAVTGADEVVRQAEVAEERDEPVLHSADATASTAATRPSRSCDAASATTVRPTLAATCDVCGPIDTAGA